MNDVRFTVDPDVDHGLDVVDCSWQNGIGGARSIIAGGTDRKRCEMLSAFHLLYDRIIPVI